MRAFALTAIALVSIPLMAQGPSGGCYETNKKEIVEKIGSGDGMLVAEGWAKFEQCVPQDQRRRTLFDLYRELDQSGQCPPSLRPAILATIREYNGGDIWSDPELSYYVCSGLHDANDRLRRFIILDAGGNDFIALSCLNDPVDYIREVALCKIAADPTCHDVYSLYVNTYKGSAVAAHSVETAQRLLAEHKQGPRNDVRKIESVAQLKGIPKEARTASWSELWEHSDSAESDSKQRVDLLTFLDSTEGRGMNWDCRMKYHLCSAIYDKSESVREALLASVSTRNEAEARALLLSFLGDPSDVVRTKAVGYVKQIPGGDSILAAYVRNVAFKVEFAGSRQHALQALPGTGKLP